MMPTREEILDWRRRHMHELYVALNSDPLADSPIIDRVFAHELDIAGPNEPKTAPTADEAAAQLQ